MRRLAAPTPRTQNEGKTGRPVGLRSRPVHGVLRTVLRRVVRAVVDIEELALFLMFVAFVYFGVGWLKIILQ